MRARILIAAGVLAVGGALTAGQSAAVAAPAAAGAAPSASASVSVSASASAEQVIPKEQARPLCVVAESRTAVAASCRRALFGTQFRIEIDCTNSGWLAGPWRRQTVDFSTVSSRGCPSGGTVQNWRIRLR